MPSRPFALLGGCAFFALAAASLLEDRLSEKLGLFCAGFACCAFFAALFKALWKRRSACIVKPSDRWGPKAFSALFLALSLAVVSFCLLSYTAAWRSRVKPVQDLDGVKACIRGDVLDYPEQAYHKYYYPVKVRRVSINGVAREITPFTARVSIWVPFSCQPGDLLECVVTFSSFDSSGGLYSTRNAYLADGVDTGAYVSDYGSVSVLSSGGTSPEGLWAWLRRTLGRGFEKRLPNRESGLIRAILLGEKNRVEDRDSENFRAVGASHMLVISGLHMAVLAKSFTVLFGWFLRKRWLRNLASSLAILAFLTLIGFPASAVRSGVMFILYLTADSLGRQNDGINSLGAAVLALCLANPFSGGDLGLSLSVSATLGILLFGDLFQRWLTRPWEKFPRLKALLRPAAASLAAACSALLLTLPFQAVVFQGISLLAPLSSLLLALPCVALLYLSLAAACLGLFPVLAPLADLCLFMAGWDARLVLRTAEWLAKLPAGHLDLSRPDLLILLSFLLLLAGLFPAAGRRTGAVILTGAILLCSGTAAGAAVKNAGKVTLAAAPDSSCVLLLQNGKAAVLSLGGYRTSAAAALLSRNNVRKIETLCLPQLDQDAREAAQITLDAFPTKRLAVPEGCYLGRDLILAGSRARRACLRDGEPLEVLEGITATPSQGMALLELEVNGNSIIIETASGQGGNCRFLFTNQEKTNVNSTFTVLQNDDIMEEHNPAAAGLPPGEYLLPGRNGVYLDLFPDGTSAIRGDTACLTSQKQN